MNNLKGKRILILSAVFPPEPVVSAKLSFDTATELSKQNAVTVISPSPSRPSGFHFTGDAMHFGFKHIVADSFVCPTSGIKGRMKESYSFGKFCSQYIAENHQHIDVIYANTWPLLAQYLSVKAARKYKIPIIVHVQDIYPESLSKKIPRLTSFINSVLMPLDKYILGKSGKIVAISQKMKNYLAKSRKLDSDKIIVVPNWQDEQSFINYSDESFDTEAKPFTFMYLGNIGPVAGVDLLLKAFAMAKIDNSRLVIAGSGTMKGSLIKLAESYPGCVIEFWPVPEGKVPEVQSKADVLLLPVKKGEASTSIPSKLPAYMFSAKPVIACVDADSDTAGAIREAGCGWVIEPENIERLSSLMSRIVLEPAEKWKDFGINGRNYAIANYSKKSNLSKLITVITEILP